MELSFSKLAAACFSAEREKSEDWLCRSRDPAAWFAGLAWLQSASSSWTWRLMPSEIPGIPDAMLRKLLWLDTVHDKSVEKLWLE